MKHLFLTWSFFLCFLAAYASPGDVYEAKALLERIAPAFKNDIFFLDMPAEKDVFELYSENGRIFIRGNSANSMAVGLNHYLKYYCKTSVSWFLHDAVELPETLPAVPEKVRMEARLQKRFFLNYCTFGYTMVWWKWAEWERFIDWMALNGINMPLAITGQEAVWLNVWKSFGLKEQEIKNYFTGPAHLPWHRMTNLDRWQGNLPDSWIDVQAELQKKIVSRERALNMTPVLPAFAGHVPPEIKNVYPRAKITQMSKWGGFADRYRCFFLDPLDPLFAKIQKAFLEEQTKLYGTDHVYGADPFNEIDSPSWEPEYLATVSKTIYRTIRQCDPEAQWLQMTWLFYFDRKHWTNPRINAFVNAVPRNKMILLDFFAENTEVWKYTDSYFGQPFLWCYLGNFGGNTTLTGNMRETGKRIENVIANGGDNLWGIGSTLEGFDVNPFMYEYVFEKAWNGGLSDDEWIERWADRRTGCVLDGQREAWHNLIDSVYTVTAQLGRGTLTNARPTLKGHGGWTTNMLILYDNVYLFEIWQKMLQEREHSLRSAYAFDVVNIGRQVLGNYFAVLRDSLTRAYEQRDLLRAEHWGKLMNGLLEDMETLMSTQTTFLLGKWLEDAAAFGVNGEEQQYYRKNARTLLTTWGEKGQSLNDYANRSWAGLIKGYYHERWKAFIDEIIYCIRSGNDFDAKSFRDKMVQMEQDFVDTDCPTAGKPVGNAVEVARQLMEKYRPLILKDR